MLVTTTTLLFAVGVTLLLQDCSASLPQPPRTTIVASGVRQHNGNGITDHHLYDNNEEKSESVQFIGENRAQYGPPRQSTTTPSSQQYSYASTNPGNTKAVDALFKQASTASISVLFVLLIWRALSAYEMAAQFDSGIIRVLLVAPTVLIMLLNVSGFIVNITKPMNFKNWLKAILAANIIREWGELLFNLVMMITTTSNSAAMLPREAYFGRMFMNVWWTAICVSFSRSRWVLQPTMPSSYAEQLRQHFQQQQEQQQYRYTYKDHQ